MNQLWCKEDTQLLFEKDMQLHIANCIIFLKSNRVFFIPIDSFHYSVHKNIKILFTKKKNSLRDILYFKCIV